MSCPLRAQSAALPACSDADHDSGASSRTHSLPASPATISTREPAACCMQSQPACKPHRYATLSGAIYDPACVHRFNQQQQRIKHHSKPASINWQRQHRSASCEMHAAVLACLRVQVLMTALTHRGPRPVCRHTPPLAAHVSPLRVTCNQPVCKPHNMQACETPSKVQSRILPAYAGADDSFDMLCSTQFACLPCHEQHRVAQVSTLRFACTPSLYARHTGM